MTVIGISQPTTLALQYSRLQRNYLWDVLLPDIDFPIGEKLGGLLQGLQGFAMAQYVQGVRFGDYDVATTTMKYGPYQANFPGLLSVGKVTISFLKPMPDFISGYFYGWKKLMIDKNNLYVPKNKYQKNIYVRFLDATGLTINRYKLTGCFPVKFPGYNLNYEQDAVTIFDVELAVDKIEIE
jgi:hypothetical protein